VDAHCTDTVNGHCPGGRNANGNSDETKCDGAPVYQRVGEGGGVDGSGPVLYRYYGDGGYTQWRVGTSDALASCGNNYGNERTYGGFDSYLSLGSNQAPPCCGGAPTAPGYSAGDGWTDIDIDSDYDPTPARGTISVSAGGGGGH
jgi:hypothetical protein